MLALGTWCMFRFSLDASAARCPSVCLMRQTVPKGRSALEGSGLNRGFIL